MKDVHALSAFTVIVVNSNETAIPTSRMIRTTKSLLLSTPRVTLPARTMESVARARRILVPLRVSVKAFLTSTRPTTRTLSTVLVPKVSLVSGYVLETVAIFLDYRIPSCCVCVCICKCVRCCYRIRNAHHSHVVLVADLSQHFSSTFPQHIF